MIGYTLIRAGIPVELPAADIGRPGRQLYRYTTTGVSAGGTTRVVQPSSYLYLTPGRLGLSSAGETYEILPGGSRVTVCPQPDAQPSSPFGAAAQSAGWCRPGRSSPPSWRRPMPRAATRSAAATYCRT